MPLWFEWFFFILVAVSFYGTWSFTDSAVDRLTGRINDLEEKVDALRVELYNLQRK